MKGVVRDVAEDRFQVKDAALPPVCEDATIDSVFVRPPGPQIITCLSGDETFSLASFWLDPSGEFRPFTPPDASPQEGFAKTVHGRRGVVETETGLWLVDLDADVWHRLGTLRSVDIIRR